MSTSFRPARVVLPLLLPLLLAGCAGMGARSHEMSNSSSMGGTMDMQAMCEMHKQQMAGKSPQEREAAMNEHMRSMTPEMRERMQSMMQQCR